MVGCQRCGVKYKGSDIQYLTFHHRKREEKLFNIGMSKWTHHPYDIFKEMMKCDVLCLACHREVENPNPNTNPGIKRPLRQFALHNQNKPKIKEEPIVKYGPPKPRVYVNKNGIVCKDTREI